MLLEQLTGHLTVHEMCKKPVKSFCWNVAMGTFFQTVLTILSW